MYHKSHIFYLNKNHHFFNDVFIGFLHFERIIINFNSFDVSESIDIIEIYNKLLKKILRKDTQIGIK